MSLTLQLLCAGAAQGLVTALTDTVRDRPQLVQRFVDASIEGWVSYLYGDRSQANALMLADNPDMAEAELEAAVALMKSMGIVDSGDTLTQGIGAMSAVRVADFHGRMVEAGLYKAGEVDLAKVADYRFVNRKVGLERKRNLVVDTPTATQQPH